MLIFQHCCHFVRNAFYDLQNWHKILGHSNESDIKKLPNLVKGITPNYALDCDICIQGNMFNDRNKTLDRKATKILTHVQSNLAGHIQPLAKDDHKYVLNSIDDYSGLMLYFIKDKSDTFLITTKYLVDIAPYDHVKCLQTETMEPSSLLNLFNSYLYLTESNTNSQLLILHIKVKLLSVHGEPYFP